MHLVLSVSPAQCDFKDLVSDGFAGCKSMAVVGSKLSAHLKYKKMAPIYFHMKSQLSSEVECVVIQDMGARCHSSHVSKCNYNDWG